MGGGPPDDAYICKYNKQAFNTKLDVIRDSHEVSQYYASILLLNKLPIRLDYYKTYNPESEEYFNPTRKTVLTDLKTSYHDFYQYLTNFKDLYEQNNNTDGDRRKIIEDVFNKCYIVQKYLIEDLWEDCNGQTKWRIEPKPTVPIVVKK